MSNTIDCPSCGHKHGWDTWSEWISGAEPCENMKVSCEDCGSDIIFKFENEPIFTVSKNRNQAQILNSFPRT